jgi:RNA polymerase sigma-70 factor (ECF subfamily)
MNTERIHEFPVRRGPSAVRRVSAPVRERETRSAASGPMLYLRPVRFAEPLLEFYSFDATYIASLCAGDLPTQEHFVGYFTALIRVKLRSRLNSPEQVEDVRQETFARVLKALRNPGTLRQPERFGAFVNTVCNNVLFEYYRSSSRSKSLDEEGQPELPDPGSSALDIASAKQMKAKVAEILEEIPLRDRKLLKAVFIEERDRDEVCREFGVDREYLRVLLHRAKREFKAEYLKRMGNPPTGTAGGWN